MNKATLRALNNIELSVLQVGLSSVKPHKPKRIKSSKFTIRPNFIEVYTDSVNIIRYKRVKDSCYWYIPKLGKKNHHFHIIAHISI